MAETRRADIYALLAETLAEPPEWMARPGCEWPLFDLLTQLAAESDAARHHLDALACILPEDPDQRLKRYSAIFASGKPRFWLYESAALTGTILSPLTFNLAKLYRACGLDAAGAELPDHASLELAFLAYLSGQADANPKQADEWLALEGQFIREHGDWLIQLGRALSASGDAVYAPVGQLLADWLSGPRAGDGNGAEAVELATGRATRAPVIPRVEDCTLCGFCAQVCPVHALVVRENESETTLMFNPQVCTGCGKCEKICDTKALTLMPISDESFDAAQIPLCQSARAICPACRKPTVSRAELAYVAAQLGSPAWLNYCLDCRPQFYGG